MRRVAPNLYAFHSPLPKGKAMAAGYVDHERLWPELRALLAVASILRRAVKEARSGKASDHIKTLHAAERALARLDKCGGTGSK